MKAGMMIKALILVHLWTLIVTFSAWALQRDGGKPVGASFPTPKIWLSLIALCFLPSIISFMPFNASVNLPQLDIFETLAEPMSPGSEAGPLTINYVALYIGLCLLLMGRTLWRWSRLQCLSLSPTETPDIFTTTDSLPPLTLSWPRRVIVIPKGYQSEPALIRHERVHLNHKDAEITLGLLLVNDILLRNPAMSYLVRQWRLAIELRADQAATKMLTSSDRQDYANLLLHSLRRTGHHADGGALPCPTAHLTSTRHRSVKMRLTHIMKNKPNSHKHRWRAALLLTTLGSGIIGFSSMSAMATDRMVGDRAVTFQADEIVYVERVPPRMPASCPGLNVDTIEIKGKEMMINGVSKYQHVVTVGYVVMKYDARPDGSTHNHRIVKSNDPCFEPSAKASLAQWIIKPQDKDIKDITIVMRFMMTGETHEDLNGQLNEFLQTTH